MNAWRPNLLQKLCGIQSNNIQLSQKDTYIFSACSRTFQRMQTALFVLFCFALADLSPPSMPSSLVMFAGLLLWLGQPHLIKKLEATFGEDVSKLQKFQTPGTPEGRVLKPKEGEATLDDERQSRYQSGVGLLLYLVKWSRPDIANATRELAK